MVVDHPTYFADTLKDVPLARDSLTLHDVQLVPRPSFSFSGKVLENDSITPVQDVSVTLSGDDLEFSRTTDANGRFSVAQMYSGKYAVTLGLWGYRSPCPDSMIIDSTLASPVFYLEKGYADDFSSNLGWTFNANVAQGKWERGVPLPTDYQGDPLNPSTDAPGDCGEKAFVTGNSGTYVNDDDVNGRVLLRSPFFDATSYQNPLVAYHRWFVSLGSDGTGDDTLFVILDNGSKAVRADTITGNNPDWTPDSLLIGSYIVPTATMQVTFMTEDVGGPHVVEAGVDRFEVKEAMNTGIARFDKGKSPLRVFPQPAHHRLNVRIPDALRSGGRVVLYDLMGKPLLQHPIRPNVQDQSLSLNEIPSGTYYLVLQGEKGGRRSVPVTVMQP